MSKFDEVLSRRSKQASSKAVPKGSREDCPDTRTRQER